MSEHAGTAPAGDERGADDRQARAGAITYLHIPAADVRGAARFYRDAFGWRIDDPDGDRPSFEQPGGHLAGAWVSDHVAATAPGLLPYIYVDDVEETVEKIRAGGGEIVTEPFPEGLLTVATFRDPAGNVLGLWHDTSRSTG